VVNVPSISEALREAQKALSALDTAKLDIEVLLAHVLKKNRSYLRAYGDYRLTEPELQQFQTLIIQRAQKIPVAYLTGEKEFWSLNFKVTPNVLIPRPDTELLVEKILQDYSSAKELTLFDLGTGSGAIAIALAHEKPNWKIIAGDISEEALAIAKENFSNLAKTANVTFIHSHWLDQFPSALKADVIVSNPPYLAQDDPHLLDSEISHEPKLALTSMSGTEAYYLIAQQAKAFLKPEGRLYFEHGCAQGEEIRKFLRQSGYQDIYSINDLANLPRVTIGSAGDKN
jgi:release factor glutamine methyltransferase